VCGVCLCVCGVCLCVCVMCLYVCCVMCVCMCVNKDTVILTFVRSSSEQRFLPLTAYFVHQNTRQLLVGCDISVEDSRD
jgi:hypothetical protein